MNLPRQKLRNADTVRKDGGREVVLEKRVKDIEVGLGTETKEAEVGQGIGTGKEEADPRIGKEGAVLGENIFQFYHIYKLYECKLATVLIYRVRDS